MAAVPDKLNKPDQPASDPIAKTATEGSAICVALATVGMFRRKTNNPGHFDLADKTAKSDAPQKSTQEAQEKDANANSSNTATQNETGTAKTS